MQPGRQAGSSLGFRHDERALRAAVGHRCNGGLGILGCHIEAPRAPTAPQLQHLHERKRVGVGVGGRAGQGVKWGRWEAAQQRRVRRGSSGSAAQSGTPRIHAAAASAVPPAPAARPPAAPARSTARASLPPPWPEWSPAAGQRGRQAQHVMAVAAHAPSPWHMHIPTAPRRWIARCRRRTRRYVSFSLGFFPFLLPPPNQCNNNTHPPCHTGTRSICGAAPAQLGSIRWAAHSAARWRRRSVGRAEVGQGTAGVGGAAGEPGPGCA